MILFPSFTGYGANGVLRVGGERAGGADRSLHLLRLNRNGAVRRLDGAVLPGTDANLRHDASTPRSDGRRTDEPECNQAARKR